MLPHPQPFTRRYATDAEYASDAQQLAASGWRVSSSYREPTGAIVATYGATAAPAVPPREVPSWLFGFIIGAVIVIACCGVPLATTALSPSASSSTPMANVSAQTDTPTPILQRVSGARLGGPMSAFDQTFGVEFNSNMWHTTIAGHPVLVDVTRTNVGESQDDQTRVILIDISPLSGGSWSASQEQTLAASFLPMDAVATQTMAGSGKLGPDHIFTSQQLANSLTLGVFQNVPNTPVAPGTFDWICASDGTFCDIAIGTNN